MAILTALTLWALVASQEDPARQAQDFVEKLRSDQIEERDEAARNLKRLGKTAHEALERAQKDSDPEMASRARQLLRVIALMEELTPSLLREMQGIEERLAFGGEEEWMEAIREADAVDIDGRNRHPGLVSRDMEGLVRGAFRTVRKPEHRSALCLLAREWDVRSALPEIIALLDDS